MIIVLDPQQWLWGDLQGASGDPASVLCSDAAGVGRAAAGHAGRGDLLVVCHPDGAAAVALARGCAAEVTLPAIVICGPGEPPEDTVGLLGCIVIGNEGRRGRIAAAATLLGLHQLSVAANEKAAAAEAEAVRCRDLHAAGIELLGRVSHDLKSPLAVIRGYLSLILEERYGRTREELFEGLGIVSRRSAQMEMLVGQLLDLARIERGTGTMNAEPLDLGAVVSEARGQVADELRERGGTLSVEIPSPAPTVMADKAKLLTIIRNVLSNAVRHGRRGGVVTLRVAAEALSVKIEVSDNGPGVDPAHGGAALQRFFDNPGTTGREIGIGLGLTVVRQFVRLHGGRVQVTSGPDGGLTFSITLPIDGPGQA